MIDLCGVYGVVVVCYGSIEVAGLCMLVYAYACMLSLVASWCGRLCLCLYACMFVYACMRLCMSRLTVLCLSMFICLYAAMVVWYGVLVSMVVLCLCVYACVWCRTCVSCVMYLWSIVLVFLSGSAVCPMLVAGGCACVCLCACLCV